MRWQQNSNVSRQRMATFRDIMAVLAPLYGPRLRLANLWLLLPSPSYPMRTCSLCSHSQLLFLLFFFCLCATLIQTLQEEVLVKFCFSPQPRSPLTVVNSLWFQIWRLPAWSRD